MAKAKEPQVLNFIHLEENPRTVSGFSRKAYQLKLDGKKVIRTYGPVSIVNRKTVFDYKKVQIDKCRTMAEVKATVTQIINDRIAHGYRLAKPGEVPVNA